MKAVLISSIERFESFKNMLNDYNIEVIILNFDDDQWIDFDYNSIDIFIYYPSFLYNSNYPLTLWNVHDNLKYIHENYSHLIMFPDPNILDYYNDKYKQYLFLSKNKYPIPKTLPLLSEKMLLLAEESFGYPMIVKNRFGAGGDSVFKVNTRKELEKYYRLSTFNIFNFSSLNFFSRIFSKRLFYYFLIKEKKMPYPFLSPPLLTQEYIQHDKDLKLVIGNNKIVEGHWRSKATADMWKVNIDGGGVGEWSYIPEEAIEIGEKIAKHLKASWINLDLFSTSNGFLISEFSPVWHHYSYKEKPNFIYKDDYNIKTPLQISLNLEKIIVESLINMKKKK